MNNKIKILNTEYANFGSIKNILRKKLVKQAF